jgi:putative hydrolase of the HAD superfamily
MITTIGFDADDTLWHNESLFSAAQEKLRSILSRYHSPEWIDRKLLETERKNLEWFGYGAKGFALSMLETALELSENRITGAEVRAIIDALKEMLKEPVSLLDGVEEVLLSLSQRYKLVLITKGDLFEQESKIARSELSARFTGIEIISEKNADTYRRILTKYGVAASEFLMVGNSMRSDVLPVLSIGASAVQIPYVITWAHEVIEASPPQDRFGRLEHIKELPVYLEAQRS